MVLYESFGVEGDRLSVSFKLSPSNISPGATPNGIRVSKVIPSADFHSIFEPDCTPGGHLRNTKSKVSISGTRASLCSVARGYIAHFFILTDSVVSLFLSSSKRAGFSSSFPVHLERGGICCKRLNEG